MVWKGVSLITNTESPVVVVLRCLLFLSPRLTLRRLKYQYSGSMEPAFSRGDILLLANPSGQQYRTGDITVYKVPGQDIPIVHRVIETRDLLQQTDE
jgi:signal peptidase